MTRFGLAKGPPQMAYRIYLTSIQLQELNQFLNSFYSVDEPYLKTETRVDRINLK
jgi:hypothetical protein